MVKIYEPGDIYRNIRLSRHEAMLLNLGRVLPDQSPRRGKKREIFQPVGLCLVNSEVSGGEWAYVNEAGDVVDAPDFDRHPLFTGPQDEIIDGQFMVRFPASWIQRRVNFAGPHVGKEVWFAHHGPRTGYELHNAFWWDGLPKSKFWLGKYQASLDEDARLSSVPGVLPAVSISLEGFDTAACLRNEDCSIGGWVQQNFWMWSWLQYLTLLRYSTMDVQAAVGQGRVSASSTALVDAPDVAEATVFGVVGAWGNVWQFAVGAQSIDSKLFMYDKLQQPYDTEYVFPDNSGSSRFFLTISNHIHGVFLPETVTSERASALSPDSLFFRSGTRALLVGGSIATGTGAGMCHMNMNLGPNSSNSSAGSRLAKVDA